MTAVEDQTPHLLRAHDAAAKEEVCNAHADNLLLIIGLIVERPAQSPLK
eukprot:CAMPEP_0194535958 /NCGR_PEP_ID=MMETSP0253-20130528/74720_1 /TAXON_ID=2966 /ORGANISM="Noctiluca scintillans" /LENGTH=48 /DNA_ID= /DNA_START= /DNA_END= /DNA_ORIENTATION=